MKFIGIRLIGTYPITLSIYIINYLYNLQIRYKMTEPDKVVFLINDKRSTSEEHNKVQGLTLQELQTFINSEIPVVTGPAGPPGSDGVTGPPGPTGSEGPTGTAPLFETQFVETLMRTPLDINLGPTGLTGINIIEGTSTQNGTLSTVISNTVTYTPNPRVPRYPKTNSSDIFTYTGTYNGETVTGIVNINIKIATPTNKYVATTSGGNLYASKYVGSTITDEQITDVSSWSDMIGTNNLDGIVLHADSGGIIKFWDPVDGATGSVDISSDLNYVADYITSEGATFDNDNGFFYIFSQPATGSPTTVWFYRITFETFETGGSLIVSSIDVGSIYDDLALSSAFTDDNFGDVAWDPTSQRIWGCSEGDGLGGNPVLWYINTRSWSFSTSQGNDPSYMATFRVVANSNFALSQLSFSHDGTVFLRYRSSNNTLYTIDERTISTTSIGSPSVTYNDLASWPVTLDENFV